MFVMVEEGFDTQDEAEKREKAEKVAAIDERK
jgi:hypothetical protein